MTPKLTVASLPVLERIPVKEKLKSRIRILRKWIAYGVPQGKYVPDSITTAAAWEDKSLGIVRIGSPNSVTRDHRTNGALVQELEELILQLQSLVPKTAEPKRLSLDAEFEALLLDAYGMIASDDPIGDKEERTEVVRRLAEASKRFQAGVVSIRPVEKRGLLREKVEDLTRKIETLGRQWSIDREARLRAERDNSNLKVHRDRDLELIKTLEAEKAELIRQIRMYKNVAVLRS